MYLNLITIKVSNKPYAIAVDNNFKQKKEIVGQPEEIWA